MYWVTGKKFLSERKEKILDKYKPPLKSSLLKHKIERVNFSLKRILHNDDLIKKINQYRKTLLLNKVNVYDAVAAFKEADSCGFFNRHDFSNVIVKLLIHHKVIDPYHYDKKNVDDTVNKLFSILDKNVDGIVDMDEIIACTFLCSGSIGDRIKVLFDFYDYNDDGVMSYEELQKFFYSCFTICFKARNDINFDIDIEKLSNATAMN